MDRQSVKTGCCAVGGALLFPGVTTTQTRTLVGAAIGAGVEHAVTDKTYPWP